MELEELQATWTQLSTALEQQKIVTNEIILKMTQQRYSNKFSKITFYETIGSLICFAMAGYIIVHFSSLTTWYLQLSGILCLAFLIVLPILVLRALKRIQNLAIKDANYTDMIIRFTKAKKHLLFLQRLGIYLAFLFFLAVMPVYSMISKGEDIFLNYQASVWYIPIVGAFLFFFGRWGYGCYKGITNSAETILKELES